MEKQHVKTRRPTMRTSRAALRKLLVGATFIHCMCERMTYRKLPSALLVQMIEDEVHLEATEIKRIHKHNKYDKCYDLKLR